MEKIIKKKQGIEAVHLGYIKKKNKSGKQRKYIL